MKKYVPLLLIFLSLPFCAQDKEEVLKKDGSYKGKVVDSKTTKALPFVYIVCKDKNQTIISGGITNQQGNFSINNLPLQSIFVEITFLGYKTIKKTILLTEKNPHVNEDVIYFNEEENNLDEIVIETKATNIVNKIDRKIINIGSDLTATGTNSLQLLENIPSVQVNFQSGTINLRGNSNVSVLIDGKPSNLSASKLLKQIPATAVKSVELITNPSAKYNPEGMSGIINFILKKNTVIGFNGTVNLGIEHSINTRQNTSFDLNYRTGKINIYTNYALDLGDFETFSDFLRSDKSLNQDIDYLDNSTSNYFKAGLDFYINNKNTLSFYTSQNFANTDFSVTTKVLENNTLIFNAPNVSQFDTHEQVYNLDYKLDLDDKGQNLEFEINYTKTTDPQIGFFSELINPTSKVYNYTNNINNNDDTFLANLDYTKPIANGILEIGFEARLQNTYNSINTDQEIETGKIPATKLKGNTTFNYDRDIYSGYLNYSKKYKKIAFQGGLRLEKFKVNGLFTNTEQQEIEPYNNNIFTIYPSAYFTFYASKKNEFQIGYSRRVDRPSIAQVTPIQEWTSPLTTSMGNRMLQPQFTNSLEFNYTKNTKKGYLSFGAFYRNTSDKIGRIINKDNANLDRQLLSYTNFETAKSYGLEFSASFKVYNWWRFIPSANLYEQDSQGLINNVQETRKNTLFSMRFSNSFKATNKLSFQLTSLYRGKSEGVQFVVDPYFVINTAAQLSILDGNGAITLRGTDIFDGYKLNFAATNPFPQTGHYTLEYSAVYLGFSYDFGNGKNRSRNRKYRENNETQSSGGVL